MADRSLSFLQGFDIDLSVIGTDNGPSLDRDSNGVILPSPTNVSIYRNEGVDEIVNAMQDLALNNIQDTLGNKFASTTFKSTVETYYQSIKTPVATGIANAFLANAGSTSVTAQQAIQTLYNAIIVNGMAVHFPAQVQPGTFNIAPSTPPPGLATTNQTTITTAVPPLLPPPPTGSQGQFKFASFVGEGGATEGLLSKFFDQYISVFDGGSVTLLHSGVTPAGSPGSVPGTAIVTI